MPIGTGENIQLDYGTRKHDRIRNFLREGLQAAQRSQADWHDQLRYNEDQYKLWMKKPKDEQGDESTPARDLTDRPKFESLLIPYGYANCSAAHMYTSSVFLSRTPVFQFTGRSGETQDQEMKMEAIANYQTVGASMTKTLFHWLYDPFRYGAGIVGAYWDKEIIPMSQVVEVEEPDEFTGLPVLKKKLVTVNQIGYQGNRIYPVRIYDYIWDPKVGLVNHQKGDFEGEGLFFSWMKIEEMHALGLISNRNMEVLVRGIDLHTGDKRIVGSGNFASITDAEMEQFQRGQQFKGRTKNGITVADMSWRIVPKAWGLSESPFPEIWQFGLAGEEIIIYARPAGGPHGRFPRSVLTYDIDEFEKHPRSLNTQSAPFERAMTWLFNTHIYATRKHLGNNVIADPTKLVIKDFYTKTPGDLIRMKPNAYGQDVRSFVHQLQIGDTTQGHLQDMRVMEDIGQRTTGINDNIMGQVNQGGRKSATEIRASDTFSTNRLKTVAEWYSATGFSDLAHQLTTNTQHHLEGEQVVKILGDLIRGPQDFEQFMKITKEDIAGFYDFVPVDGSLPADRFAQGNLFRELYGMILQNEQLSMQYDLKRLTEFTASLYGIRNLKRFEIQQDQLMSPQQLEQGQDAGNVVPLAGAAG